MNLLIMCAVSSLVGWTAPSPLVSAEPFDGERALALSRIESVEVPSWSIHLCVCRCPALNELQKAKVRIAELRSQIAEHERLIAEKRAEIERILVSSEESSENSLFLLGLYGRRTRIRDHELVYDEKSLLWGAIRWGKKLPR